MLTPLEQEFTDYAKRFNTGDEDVDQNLRLKLAHSFRVRNEATRLTDAEKFALPVKLLTIRAALLHDLSRFEQFTRFRSFNDAESFDHGNRSAELATELKMLEDLSEEDRNDVLAAIRAHNKLAIPEGISTQGKLIAGAIRDADKLDIMPILLHYLEHPDNESIVFSLSREPELSPAVRDALLHGKSPSHRDMKTVCDFIAGKLPWVYDLNFDWSRREYLKRGFLDALAKYLPDTGFFQELLDNARRELNRG